MSHSRKVAPPFCPFVLSPLNELFRGKLVHSITLIPFEIFDIAMSNNLGEASFTRK